MKVEIWSDIMCPFCYIGKRRFEAALEQFPDAGNIEIEWHSFQLDPDIEGNHGKNLYEYFSERKGVPYEQSVAMHQQMAENAKHSGLTYNFDTAVVANSFDAHRLIQLAKTHHLGDAAEERLFKAYFTEGKDFSDHDTLVALGTEIGLEAAEVRKVLDSTDFSDAVKADINEAAEIGINGVPFFVFNRKYAVSGAQASTVFEDVLQKSYKEYKKEQPKNNFEIIDGQSCTPDGKCD